MTSIIAVTEGVDVHFLRRNIERLPWFKQNMEAYPNHILDCGPVPYEPTNLTTILTGQDPGQHGCFSFWDLHSPCNHPPKILNSNDVQAKRLWDWPELSDVKFGVFNIPLTFPVTPLNGVMYAYLMKPSLRYTYPSNFQHNLSKIGVRYGHDVSVFYEGGDKHDFFNKVLQVHQLQENTLKYLADEFDVLIVNLTLADRVSHFLWNQPELILKAYEALDATLLDLEKFVGDDDFMMVLSEIGYGELKEFISLDACLEKMGAHTRTADGTIDESSTLMYETPQGSHGLNILVQEKDIVKRRFDSEYQIKLEEAKEILLSLTFDDGKPILDKVWFSEEVYFGDNVCLAPDLIVKPADLARPPMGHSYWAKKVHRHYQTGWHRYDGFCMLLSEAREAVDYFSKDVRKLTDIAPFLSQFLLRNARRLGAKSEFLL